MTGPVLFKRIALIGIGLIGSSLARVVKRDGLAGHIAACARSAETLEAATRLGIADSTTRDPVEAVRDADLVIICTPIGSYGAIAKAIAPALVRGAIVSDVGSVKRAVIESLAPLLPAGVHLVPGHPIAGTENSGPEAGFDTLFEGRWFIITPPEGTDPEAVERVAELWRRTGSLIAIMDAGHHDNVLAITSHIPHLIAYTIVGTATDLEDDLKSEVVKYSDPVMWRDIFLNNREAVLEMLGRFTEDLTALQRAVRIGDGAALEALFTRTRELRRGVVAVQQHIPPAPEKE